MKKLKVCFVGGNQAGIIGALSILSSGNKILCAVSYSQDLTNILKILKIPLFNKINNKGFIERLSTSDLLLSVHGREIIKPDLFKLPKLGAINIHPYLYMYKGAKPVDRAFRDGNFRASVGAHIIEKQVDEGAVVIENFIDVSGSKGVEEIYNKLYPHYSIIILKILEMAGKGRINALI